MEKINLTKLDGGTIDERLNKAKELFGLSHDRSFQDLKIGKKNDQLKDIEVTEKYMILEVLK